MVPLLWLRFPPDSLSQAVGLNRIDRDALWYPLREGGMPFPPRMQLNCTIRALAEDSSARRNTGTSSWARLRTMQQTLRVLQTFRSSEFATTLSKRDTPALWSATIQASPVPCALTATPC